MKDTGKRKKEAKKEKKKQPEITILNFLSFSLSIFF